MSLTPALEKTFKLDKEYLEKTQFPIVTVSASSKEDLKGLFGLPEDESITDIVFSRAHYSMALAVAVTVWKKKIDYQKAWIVDPTNYVSHQNWKSIVLTDYIGRTLARKPLLKKFKDLIDKFARSKLPILPSITPPLLHLTEKIKKPIISLHIAAGNILVEHGKKVLQVITDPHVREEYLKYAESPKIRFCVFDHKTKTEFLEKAAILGKQINDKKVIVTGPPVDPRIIKDRKLKKAWRSGVLNLVLTTGGLGTNKAELRKILSQLLPKLRKKPNPFNLMLYAGTHQDIFAMAKKLAKQERVYAEIIKYSQQANILDKTARQKHHQKFYILYHPQIVDANELLIEHAFGWADGFITKPSGDMAYDAAASGSFILTLKEWGEWEDNIRQFFEQHGISRKAQVDNIVSQLEALMTSGWIEKAMNQAHVLNGIFDQGTKNILLAASNF